MDDAAITPATHTGAVGRHDHSGAGDDAALVELWLRSKRSAHTRRAYGREAANLLGFLHERGRTLRSARLVDVQAWADGLTGAASTRARRISAAKSLITFGHRTGYLHFNVGRVLETPSVPNQLAERILTEEELHRLLAAATGRNEIILRLLYSSGARVAELCGLRWQHVHWRDDGDASLTLHGKGGKTRHILVSRRVATDLATLKPDGAHADSPVFATRSGRPLHPANVAKMVRATARRAGIDRPVSPHWLRHAHASHALDRGAPVHLVQQTLGHASVATTGRYLHARPGDGSARYLSV